VKLVPRQFFNEGVFYFGKEKVEVTLQWATKRWLTEEGFGYWERGS
jgi:hypothetical protein